MGNDCAVASEGVAKTRSGPGMGESHKAALAEGREHGRAVRRYLEAIEAQRPRRGRRRTPESVRRRLDAIDEKLNEADALTRLHLSQERMNLQAELAGSEEVDLGPLEAAFIKAALPYARLKGITYAAWRQAGVEPRVLRAAGVSPERDEREEPSEPPTPRRPDPTVPEKKRTARD